MKLMGQKTPRMALLEVLILAGIIALLSGWGQAEAQHSPSQTRPLTFLVK